MKKILILLLVALDVAAQPGSDLIPVRQENQWSYINTKGENVITTGFKNARFFSEGLAAVRVGGHYGYIDEKGSLKIPAVYDYGSDFKDGLAQVVKNGLALIIDKQNKIKYEGRNGEVITSVNENHIIIKKRETARLYDLKGRWVLESGYETMYHLDDSLYVVYKISSKRNSTSIYNLNKGFILPFGAYSDYHLNTDGSISLKKSIKRKEIFTVVDRYGKVLMTLNDEESMYPNVEYDEGLVTVNYYGKEDYENYVDAEGNSLFTKNEIKSAKPFSAGHAFVQFKDKGWQLINRQGKLKSTEEFSYVGNGFYLDPTIRTYVCMVNNQSGWGLIDTLGHLLIEPKFKDLNFLDLDQGLYLATSKLKTKEEEEYKIKGDHHGNDSLENLEKIVAIEEKKKTLTELLDYDEPQERFGIVNAKGIEILPCIYKDLSPLPISGLYYFEDDSISGIINNDRRIIYMQRSEKKEKTLDTLDIDYMERGYCYAASAFEIYTNLGGHGGSSNEPLFGISQLPVNRNELFLFVDTLQPDTFYSRYAGHPLYLVNGSADTVVLNAQDGRLYITMQVFHDGKWKDIEYSPSSWCGNSYHEVGILSGLYWKFTTPVYKGSMKLQMRFQLIGEKKWNGKKRIYEHNKTIVSNTFTGSINPAQLWKKKGHTPTGIMDPYNE